jgi:hypothetical protein
MDSDDDDLAKIFDTSWIRDQERLHRMESGYYREPMDQIEIKTIYINQNQYIEKIMCEKLSLIPTKSGSGAMISEEMMLKLVQKRKRTTPTSKYKLEEVITYVVDLEPEEINAYAATSDATSSEFYKPMRMVGEVILPNSIFIFHSINTLYFIFREVEIEKHRHTVKPILKKISEEKSREPVKNTTKKVRINEQPTRQEPRKHGKHTRKHRDNIN